MVLLERRKNKLVQMCVRLTQHGKVGGKCVLFSLNPSTLTGFSGKLKTQVSLQELGRIVNEGQKKYC